MIHKNFVYDLYKFLFKEAGEGFPAALWFGQVLNFIDGLRAGKLQSKNLIFEHIENPACFLVKSFHTSAAHQRNWAK